jgi:hypothetical protein
MVVVLVGGWGVGEGREGSVVGWCLPCILVLVASGGVCVRTQLLRKQAWMADGVDSSTKGGKGCVVIVTDQNGGGSVGGGVA